MKLHSLELTDFRPFFGTQTIQFAEGSTRNVTLIHAQNGTGKTAILNALLWAFHERFTGNFNDQTLLVNSEAYRQGKRSCRVAVSFSHEGQAYELVRTYDSATRRSMLRVSQILENGERKPHPQQSAFVQQVFPKEMAPYFFFDGEYATNFATSTSSGAVRAAIREMLGCTAAENALLDIKVLERKVNTEIRDRAPSLEVQELQDRLAFCTNIVEQSESRIIEIQKERVTEVSVLRAIDEFLLQHAATAEYQKERQVRESELARAEGELRQEVKSRSVWVAKNAALVCSEAVALKCEELYAELENKAQIPAPYNEEFVRALLGSGKCICDRCLEPGSAEASAVTNLLSNATDSVVQRRLINVKAFCRRLSQRKVDAINQLQAVQSRISSVETRRHSIQQRVTELNRILSGVQNVDLKTQETARSDKRRAIDRLAAEESRLKEAKQSAAQEISSIDAKITARAVHDSALRKLTARKEFLGRCAAKLNIELEALETNALQVLRKDTNELLAKIFRQEIEARIDENFAVTLYNSHDEPVPPSGGQAQLVSLAFLASLIRYCAKREKDKSAILQPGTVAPFVLDSPFGQLDPLYRKGAAGFLPEYSSQIVFLLSTSQGDPQTLSEMRGKIGSEAVLIKENAGSRPAAQEDLVEEIEVNGAGIVVTFWNKPVDLTKIENLAYYGEDEQ